jgi:uncharacterized protein with NRDE domain
MCLVVFAWQADPRYPLILAANRDEQHGRPAEPMSWWADRPDVLAGRDLQAGGTWLAIGRRGRFATVTNYREHQRPAPGLASRGNLVTDFVDGQSAAGDFLRDVAGERYAGFNLLAGDGDSLWYASNRGDGPVPLEPGVYGLSNASLDAPWWKLIRTRETLRDLVADGEASESTLLRLLADRETAPASDIEPGKLPFEIARAESAPFIVNDVYGTRCTTTVMWASDGRIDVAETRFDPTGRSVGRSSFRISRDGVQP